MDNQASTMTSKPTGMFQKTLFTLLAKLQYGQLLVHDDGGAYEFGSERTPQDITVNIQIKNKQFYKKVVLNGVLGAAESYIDGDWETDDLTQLIALFIKNTELQNKIDNPFVTLLNFIQRIKGIFRKNDIKYAKQNILAHYDLGNDFFRLFLDPTMMYSCALYEPEHISLEHASLRKLDTICQQLQLKPSDHVLEIGTGWGGFALYAARKYGCKVTTTTISDKQYAYVKNQIEYLGMQDRIELLNQDYRTLTGEYDKLVSIEMIEAVGYQYFNAFFQKCDQLLKPGGLFFLQAITINDQAYERAKYHEDFIKKYIFPGGCLPSMSVISECIASQTHMQWLNMRDIGKHYALTLMDWLNRFNQQIEQVKGQGFSERFIRTWRFYFCYCAAGFDQGYLGDIHALWKKRE